MRQVSIQIPQSRYITGYDGAGLGVSSKVEIMSTALICGKHDSRQRRLRLRRGDVKMEQPSPYVKVLSSCELRVLEGHAIGWGYLESGQVDTSTSHVHSLLHDIPLGHPFWACSPFMVQDRQIIILPDATQQEKAAGQPITEIFMNSLWLVQCSSLVLAVVAVGPHLHFQVAYSSSHVPQVGVPTPLGSPSVRSNPGTALPTGGC
jgi:hypothetical protein